MSTDLIPDQLFQARPWALGPSKELEPGMIPYSPNIILPFLESSQTRRNGPDPVRQLRKPIAGSILAAFGSLISFLP